MRPRRRLDGVKRRNRALDIEISTGIDIKKNAYVNGDKDMVLDKIMEIDLFAEKEPEMKKQKETYMVAFTVIDKDIQTGKNMDLDMAIYTDSVSVFFVRVCVLVPLRSCQLDDTKCEE